VLNRTFSFRPWVSRAGLSIALVAASLTAAIALALLFDPRARFGWMGEKPVWVYLAALWLGGLRVWLGTLRPVAELGEGLLIVRPLHQFMTRAIRWESVSGTEQTVGGDRLIVYFETARGMRFVALNLNLIKGRKEFLTMLDERLRDLGFTERVVERSRYLSKAEGRRQKAEG
jgi:hypothetical protein